MVDLFIVYDVLISLRIFFCIMYLMYVFNKIFLENNSNVFDELKAVPEKYSDIYPKRNDFFQLNFEMLLKFQFPLEISSFFG